MKYQFNISNFCYYIDSDKISNEDLASIQEVLSNFPHASKSRETIHKFLEFSGKDTPKHILAMAANAFDKFGNTMLGIACEYGSVEATEKLIAFGAKVDTIDHQGPKLALHWAICNKKSFRKPSSDAAAAVVKCLLEHGARIDIRCYQDMTPLEYAKDRGYTAAAKIIECHSGKSHEACAEETEAYGGFKPGF